MKQFTSAIFRIATLAVLTVTVAARAEIVPADRRVDWTPGVTVGVPGGIPTNRTNRIDVSAAPYNADKTGVSDATAAIQAAINAANSGDIVFLPAGTYRCNGGVTIGNKSGITLRGEGDKTVIKCYSTGQSFLFVGSMSDYNWSWPNTGNMITGGGAKGSTVITIGDTSAFSVGQMVQLARPNDTSLPVASVLGFGLMQRQLTRITAKTATTLTVFPALYTDFSGGNSVVHVAQYQANSVGIEDLMIDASGSTVVSMIMFWQCYGSWISNVHVRYSSNYHVHISNSLNCEVRHSHLDELNHSGSNGSGLLVESASGCLFEDNIIYRSFPNIEVNHGSSGNVFAYNLCMESSGGASIDTNHAPHNSYNLYEGNIAPNVQCDGYFGSASQDTIFRNWLTGVYNNQPSYTISLNRFTRKYSIVGNILGTAGLVGQGDGVSLGNPNMGNSSYSGTAQPSVGSWWKDWPNATGPSGYQELDLDVAATLNRKGNFSYFAGKIPDGEVLSEALPVSLFRTSRPSWWPDSIKWPAFDPATAASSAPTMASLPAGYRYLNGSDASSGGTTTPGTPTPPSTTQSPLNARIQRMIQ